MSKVKQVLIAAICNVFFSDFTMVHGMNEQREAGSSSSSSSANDDGSISLTDFARIKTYCLILAEYAKQYIEKENIDELKKLFNANHGLIQKMSRTSNNSTLLEGAIDHARNKPAGSKANRIVTYLEQVPFFTTRGTAPSVYVARMDEYLGREVNDAIIYIEDADTNSLSSLKDLINRNKGLITPSSKSTHQHTLLNIAKKWQRENPDDSVRKEIVTYLESLPSN